MLEKITTAYKFWHEYLKLFPKTSRYTLGGKIDLLFVEMIEAINTAAFLPKKEKLPYIRRAVTKLDSVKVFLQISWEIKALDTKRYAFLSELLAKAGQQLGGWHNQLVKQNSPESAIGRTGEK